MELEILKKLLLVQQMRKQRQSTGSNYQDEQAPQEMKSKVLPGQSGSNTSSLSSLTMPFILALIKGHREVYSRQTLTTI